jgi:TorA maturation chaperone TorD
LSSVRGAAEKNGAESRMEEPRCLCCTRTRCHRSKTSLAVSQEQDRADVYALLSALLLGPDEELVASLAALPAPGPQHADAMSRAWAGLFAAARRCGPAALAEYRHLCTGAGPSLQRPCAAQRGDGATADGPLVQLRAELHALGLARAPDAPEREDHLGALCEAMRVLIQCGHARATQQAFFGRHLAGWSARCLQELAAAPGADFYRSVAALGLAFFEREG